MSILLFNSDTGSRVSMMITCEASRKNREEFFSGSGLQSLKYVSNITQTSRYLYSKMLGFFRERDFFAI